MDRKMIGDHLAQAERRINEGEGHLVQQRNLIAELEGLGHDTAQARALLKQLEQIQALHIADRDRLCKVLELPPAPDA
jgi:hypothetical protein